jgi:hypothetical protein
MRFHVIDFEALGEKEERRATYAQSFVGRYTY